ncbi:MAG: hypothetical protein ACKPAE_01615, partial [Microcystis panniformis]
VQTKLNPVFLMVSVIFSLFTSFPYPEDFSVLFWLKKCLSTTNLIFFKNLVFFLAKLIHTSVT